MNSDLFFTNLKATKRFTTDDLDEIKRAAEFAKSIYKDRKRLDGSSVFSHNLTLADNLCLVGSKQKLIVAGLLHNVLEANPKLIKTLVNDFGEEVAFLVAKQRFLKQYKYHSQKQLLNSYKRFLVGNAQDVRVLILILIDRWHDLQTIVNYFPEEKQKRLAKESLLIHGRLANYFSLYQIQHTINDSSFLISNPKDYHKVEELRRLKIKKSAKTIKSIKRQCLIEIVDELNYQPIIKNRVKTVYSLYQKLVKKKWDINDIQDLIGFRIIVETKSNCYQVLSLIHGHYQSLEKYFTDYIARPKANGYQSIHTTITFNNTPIEFQIRTKRMDEDAEKGVAAHYIYKESESAKRLTSNNWLVKIKDLPTETNKFKPDFRLYKDRIFVFTPKKDVIDLPEDATALDFAYAIHGQIGQHAKGALINNVFKPLKTKLSDKDVVEIVIDKKNKPTRQWLHWSITKRARSAIRRALRISNMI